MSKMNNSRVATILGAVTVSKFVRAILSLAVGMPFMISGTIYSLNTTLFEINPLIIVASWMGFFWINISSSFIFIFVLIPPLNKSFFKIKYWKSSIITNNADRFLILNKRDVEELRSSIKKFSLKSNRGKRIIYSLSLSYIILCLQTWSLVNMILDYNFYQLGYSYGNYWNFIKVISLKTIVVNFNYASPIPGDMLVAEWSINTIFSDFFYSIYNANLNSLPSETITKITEISASQMSFVARFWTFYLPQLYKLVFLLFGITFIFYSRRFKRAWKL